MDAATPSRVAGLDWASRLHAVCVLEPDGQVRARFEVPHTGRELRGVDPPPGPARRGPGRDRAARRPGRGGAAGRWAGGRRDPGPPGQSAPRPLWHGRQQDDRFDAYVLADALRTDGHRLAPLRPDAPETTALRVVSRARKSLVATRVALANELRANLEISFPGAATLFSDVDSPIALAFCAASPR